MAIKRMGLARRLRFFPFDERSDQHTYSRRSADARVRLQDYCKRCERQLFGLMGDFFLKNSLQSLIEKKKDINSVSPLH